MAEQKITNAHGIRFYLERSADFDDDGRMKAGRGWYAGLIEGQDYLGGVFFETKEAAISAIHEYTGRA